MITNVTLTQKERTLLEDQKNHEQICILKYSNYSNQAKDPELKSIFNQNKSQEETHLNSINQLLSGQLPSMGNDSVQSGKNTMSGNSTSSSTSGSNLSAGIQSDKDLCTDILMTEKYVSGTYDTSIFEFKDPKIRDVLNHIQKEEQKHGEAVFQYMERKGMYQTH